MTTPAHPMFNIYRAQVAGARQIVDAALAGLDRLEHLTLTTLREAADDQFQLAETVSQAIGNGRSKDLAQLQAQVTQPAAQRLMCCQRDLWAAFSEMNGAMAKACSGLMGRVSDAVVESAAQLSPALKQPQAMAMLGQVGSASPWNWYENTLKQWQALVPQPLTPTTVSDSVAKPMVEPSVVTQQKAATKKKKR